MTPTSFLRAIRPALPSLEYIGNVLLLTAFMGVMMFLMVVLDVLVNT